MARKYCNQVRLARAGAGVAAGAWARRRARGVGAGARTGAGVAAGARTGPYSSETVWETPSPVRARLEPSTEADSMVPEPVSALPSLPSSWVAAEPSPST